MVYLKSVENVITLGKLIGLLFLFCLPLLSILFLKTKRSDLARPVMGTIFLVGRAKRAPHWGVQSRFRMIYICRSVCLSWSKKRRRNYVGQTRACSKSVLGGKIRPVTPILFISTIR